MHSKPALLTVVAACWLLSGCGGPGSRDATVSGTVLVNGQLAERGMVTFHPVGGGPPAVGRIHSNGTYSVRTGQGDLSDPDGGTLHSGEYKVTIVVHGEPGAAIMEGGPPNVGPRLTAAKYASVETTDLERTVKPGKNLFVFELERETAADASADAAEEGGPPEEKVQEAEQREAEVIEEDTVEQASDDNEASSDSQGDSDEGGDSTADVEEPTADTVEQPQAVEAEAVDSDATNSGEEQP